MPVSFTPTEEWQDVPEGAVLPAGCQVEMDQSTGRTRARKPPNGPASTPDFAAAYEKAEPSEFDLAGERLAQLPPQEYDLVRMAEAKKLGVRVGTLDACVLSLRKPRSKGRTTAFGQQDQGDTFDLSLDQAQVERSNALSASPSVLELVADTIGELGAAGVRREAKILYLALSTRLLPRPNLPASVLIKGASAGGKNYLLDIVARLFPISAIYRMTGMSDRALAYLAEPMAHRFIIIAEAAGIEDSPIALTLIRSLLSEGEVRYPTVEKGEDGVLTTVMKHLEGPTGLIMTTTSPKIHNENETRHLSLNIRDDWAQTQTILREQARLAEGKEVVTVDLAPWRNYQRWLEMQERCVVIPFASRIARRVAVGPVRLRRDFPRFLTLVMAHALLHQARRKRDDQGRIIVSRRDYQTVEELVGREFAETAELAHPSSIVELVEAVRQLSKRHEDGVNIHALVKRARAKEWGTSDRDVLTRRCRDAITRGLMVNLETRKGQLARYQLTAAACEEIGLFPDVDELFRPLDRSTSRGRAAGRT